MKSDKRITQQIFLLLLMALAYSALGQQRVEYQKVSMPDIVFRFRFDQSALDTLYRDNARSLAVLDKVLKDSSLLSQLDSIVIVASASPEGPWGYNKALAESRANAVKTYIVRSYPDVNADWIETRFIGEDWARLRQLVESGEDFPHKRQMLAVMGQDIHPDTKEWRLKQVGQGAGWSYVVRNYLRELRTGAACVLLYRKTGGADTLVPIRVIPFKPELQPSPGVSTAGWEPQVKGKGAPIRYEPVIALKTNLFFDVFTLFNIEIEVPIKNRFSILGEWIFPWWGGLGNRGGISPLPSYSERYTMQILWGGVEFRYWFPRKRPNLLTGWFVGPYVGFGVYDLQFEGEGIRGNLDIATGVSGGFAHPIAKNFRLEYTLGVGYLRTTYEKYIPEQGNKVYESTGRFRWFGPAKAKVSLVWAPRFQLKRR